ncbi:MAG: type IV secretion protein IcmX, partial [Legionella sp.]
MKVLAKGTLLNLICLMSFTATAADLVENQYNPSANSGSSETLSKYVLNLGLYLGFDLTQAPPKENSLSQELTDKLAILLAQNYVYYSSLGAIPVDAMSEALSQFVPNNSPGASINKFANATFKYQNYQSPAGEGATNFSVSILMDQQTYQNDPVSQAVLNILGTPDYTVCMDYNGTNFVKDCNFLYQNKVMANVIGALPNREQFYSYDYNQKIIGQLNSNSLLGPLLYSTDAAPVGAGSETPKQKSGLAAENQIQQAANFVRYASGAVAPITLPKLKAYDTLYNQAVPADNKPNATPTAEQLKAQGILSHYFTSLRVYAAQSSVGISNLYYLFSKRLPQNPSGEESATITSQAMSEFNMATWRLFKPGKDGEQWVDRINKASPGTVEKEIATLLAEINYQMYLDRQI